MKKIEISLNYRFYNKYWDCIPGLKQITLKEL